MAQADRGLTQVSPGQTQTRGCTRSPATRRWLTKEHPDPDAFHLAIVADVAGLYLKGEMHGHPTSPLPAAFKKAGLDEADADFALFWVCTTAPQTIPNPTNTHQ